MARKALSKAQAYGDGKRTVEYNFTTFDYEMVHAGPPLLVFPRSPNAESLCSCSNKSCVPEAAAAKRSLEARRRLYFLTLRCVLQVLVLFGSLLGLCYEPKLLGLLRTRDTKLLKVFAIGR